MTDILSIIKDILSITNRFSSDISYILMKQDDEDVKAAAKSEDNSMSISVLSKTPVNNFRNIACLGSIPHLRTILDSNIVNDKNFQLELLYGKAKQPYKDETSEALESINFKIPGKSAVLYRAMDPFLNDRDKVNIIKNNIWPIEMIIDENFQNNFNSMTKIASQSPTKSKDMDDIFEMVYNNDENGMFAFFGQDRSTWTVLTHNVSSEINYKLSALFSIHKMNILFDIISSQGCGKAWMGDKAFMIEVETKNTVMKITVASRKVRNIR